MKKVLCIGEALIDFVPNDIGMSIKETNSFIKKAGGAPANVAAAVSKFGAQAYFAGCVGKDSFGDFLEDVFRNNNINTDLMIKLEDRKTTLAFVSLMEDGERDFEFMRDADSRLTFELIENRLEEFDLFHFGSATAFLDGELKDTYYNVRDYALKNNKMISFDANYRDALFNDKKEEFIKCCKDFISVSDIVKLSDEEAMLISRAKNLKDASDEIIKLGCKNLIITLGKDGAMLTTKEKQIVVPTKKMKMIDATGAGDAFMGAVLAQVLNNPREEMKSIISKANIAGGLTTTRIGALESIPTWEEVEEYRKMQNIN